MRKARGRLVHCGDWLPRSTVMRLAKAMSWAKTWASGGFGTLSLNTGLRVNQQFKLLLGVDNLLNKAYAEHLNLAGNAGFGLPANTRINEPGRSWWIRADIKF